MAYNTFMYEQDYIKNINYTFQTIATAFKVTLFLKSYFIWWQSAEAYLIQLASMLITDYTEV